MIEDDGSVIAAAPDVLKPFPKPAAQMERYRVRPAYRRAIERGGSYMVLR